MAKAKTKSVDDVVLEDTVLEEVTAVEDTVVEEVTVENLPHPNPIIQMAIDQARQRFLRETAE